MMVTTIITIMVTVMKILNMVKTTTPSTPKTTIVIVRTLRRKIEKEKSYSVSVDYYAESSNTGWELIIINKATQIRMESGFIGPSD